MRSGNPVLQNTPFAQPTSQSAGYTIPGVNPSAMAKARPELMTVRGAAMKTLYLLLITATTAAVSWAYFRNNPQMIMITLIGSLIGSFLSGFIMLRTPKISHFVVPLFAFAEGLFVAAFTVAVIHYSSLGDRIAPPMPDGSTNPEAFVVIGQAAGLTFAIAAAVLLGYATGLLRLGGMAKKMIIVITGGVMIYYSLTFVVNLIAGRGVIPNLGMDAGAIGIGFSVFVVILSSLNLLLDFQQIDEGAQRGLPKYYEWVGAFAILTTLVWLYIELLRLLAKLRSSD